MHKLSVPLTGISLTCFCLSILAIALVASIPARALASPPAEGSAARAFTLSTLAGRHLTLAQLRGHVVVVNFFATWCPPCRAETPDLVAVEKRFKSKGVIFVGVDDRESAALVSQFARSKGIRFPIALDSDGAVSRLYDVRAIPTTYVLDRDGVIRYRQVDELEGSVLASALGAVLNGTTMPETATARSFDDTANTAASLIAAGVELAKKQIPPNVQLLDAAVRQGVAANKKLDGILSQSQASSINYFTAAQTRGKLNAALADAYALRASIVGSQTIASDQTEAALLRGQILMDREQFAEAAAQYDIAMKLSPKDTRAYDGAYLAAYERKDYAKAAQLASAEAAIAPDDPESWLTVASSQNALKGYSAALEAERKALALAAQAYAKDPTSKSAAYEYGRVWLKMARTQILAGNPAAARALLVQSQAAAPKTIVEQQASEQYLALAPMPIAIDRTRVTQASGVSAQPAKVYVIVRNPSAQGRTINLVASGLPPKWLLSFCYSTVCNPYKVSFELPARGSKRVELLVAPLAKTFGPWTMSLDANGASTARVRVDAKTAKAAIMISAT